MPACDQSEHVSSAQSAKHFEQRNVVTVNASSINTFSNHHIVVYGFSCFDLEGFIVTDQAFIYLGGLYSFWGC